MATKNIAGITAKLGLDVTGVTSALKQIETKSKAIAKEMAEVDKSLKFNPESVVLAAQKQELLAEAIKNTEDKLKELSSVQKKTDNAFKNQSKWEEQYAPLKEAIDSTKAKLKELQNQNEKMQADFQSGKIDAQKYEAYQQELEATKAKMKELSQQQKDLEASFEDGHISAEEYRAYQREVENTRLQLANLKSQQDNAGKSAEDLGKTAKETGEDFKGAKSDIKTYEDAVSGLNSAIDDVNNDLKGIVSAAAGAVAAVGGAAVGAVSAATEVGAGFEQSMSKVKAISGATGDDLAALEQAAKNMGATTSKTASESADALSYMALAGWKTEEMLSGLEPILRASEAGEMDLATCSDLVTDSMSAMGVSVNDLSHYLDVVAAAQSNSNTSMQQLLEAFVECGGSAHNFGLNVEDLSTVLGVMANRGIKGSEAGTALNSIFVNMLGSTAKTAAAMDALGLSLYDQNGKMKDMTEVLKEMGGALATATDEQRNNLEAMLGGKTQITALQAMVNGLNGEYDALSETLYNCDGALLNTAKTMQDNLTGKVTEMQSALEGLGIDFYDYLEEPLKSAVQAATKEIGNLSESVTNGQLAETIERLAEQFGKLIEKTARFAADKGIPALINSLDWISRNGDKIVALIEGMGAAWAAWKIATMVTHVMSLVKAIKDFKVAQEAATAAQIAANQAAMANVYAMVAAAVAGLTIALGKLAAAQIDAAAEALREKNVLDETTKKLLENEQAIKNNIEAYSEYNNNADKCADKQRELWQEIESLVDASGHAKGSVDELQSAVNQLNAISDLNIEVIDGQIVGYGNLKNSIDDVIESQRRQAKLSYLQDYYGEAVLKKDDTLKALNEAQKAYDDLFSTEQKYFNEIQKINNFEATAKGLGYEGGMEELQQKYKEAGLDKADALVRLNALKETYSGYEKVISDYDAILKEGQTSANNSGEDSGAAFGEGFDDGVQTGSEGMEETLSATVEESIAAAKNTAEEEGKSVGESAAEALKAAIEGGMEEADLKKLVKQYISDLKYEQAKLGKDDSWLYDEEEKMLSVFGEGSAIYKEYMTTILNGRKKLAEQETKANTATKSEQKAAADKEAQAILDAMDEMYKTSVESGKEVGEAAAAAISYGMEKGLDDGDLKSAIEKYLQKADIEKALNHKDNDSWYYDQLEKMVNVLDEGGELHDDYYLKLIEGRNKVSENDEKANEKEIADAKKKEEELEKLEAKYQASFGSVFTRNQSNGKNGSKGSKRIDTEQMEKIVAAKEKLSGYLSQLAAKGMPQSVIDELLAMDPIEAVEYARILLKVPAKFESVKNLAERDRAASKKLAAVSLGTSEEFSEAGKTAGVSFATGLINTVGAMLQGALPDLSGVTAMLVKTETAQDNKVKDSETASASQNTTAVNTTKTNALLESIAILLNGAMGDGKGITVSFNPTIESVVTMDGETVAKNVTKKQGEYQVRTST
ncbi:MAG: phage tail tape measure protein [Oscillospiraceae bacterium]|nr:phage tail tape measure protein [Oscillospiraceae bacterium]